MVYYFHAETATAVIAAGRAGKESVEVSLDLNLSQGNWKIQDNGLVLPRDPNHTSVPESVWVLALADLEPVADSSGKVFCFDGKNLLPVEIRADGYYKMVPTSSVPTLEINGIKMHRSKDIDPLEDARLKTELVVRPGNNVLDTCGGLGYSALFALKAGADRVVSTEKSRQVIQIRNQNPWLKPGAFDWLTQEVFGRIHLEHGDIKEFIKGLPDQGFDAVIHDPPRFCSATGDLYGKAFYSQLARVMRTGARLFHYTGTPKRIKNGDKFVRNAMKRMEETGFKNLSFNDRLQGIYAEKARPLGIVTK